MLKRTICRSLLPGLLLAGLLLAGSGHPGASAQEASDQTAGDPASAIPAAIESLSPLVEDVQIVGPWVRGEVRGVWRTVVVQSPQDSTNFHFFVQRLSGGGAAQSIVSSLEITEIAKIEGAIVGYRADEPGAEEQDSLSLFFDILPTDGELPETYEFHLTGDDPYMFGPATN